MSQLRFHVKKDPVLTESLKTAELKRVRELPKEQITKLPVCFSTAGASTPGGGLLFPPALGQQPPQTASSVLRRLLMQWAGGRKTVFHCNKRSLLDPSSAAAKFSCSLLGPLHTGGWAPSETTSLGLDLPSQK